MDFLDVESCIENIQDPNVFENIGGKMDALAFLKKLTSLKLTQITFYVFRL